MTEPPTNPVNMQRPTSIKAQNNGKQDIKTRQDKQTAKVGEKAKQRVTKVGREKHHTQTTHQHRTQRRGKQKQNSRQKNTVAISQYGPDWTTEWMAYVP